MSDPELTVERDGRGYWRPDSEDALRALLRAASRRRQQVRVCGAAHSVPGAIQTDRFAEDHHHPHEMNLLLDRMTAVRFESSSRVAVQAGCHLGRDPHDPHHGSTWHNSLLAKLDAAGLAFNTLPAITHQTVAGALCMGSTGGTLAWSGHDALRKIRLIDGEGEVHELTREDPRFYAAGVSMGLLGVISEATFECVPRFDIVGRALCTAREHLPVDLTEAGALERFLRETPYARMLWWPQPGVDRVALWSARRMEEHDYTPERAPGGVFAPRPLRDRSASEAARWIAGSAAGAFCAILRNLPDGTPLDAALEALLPGVIRMAAHDDGPDGARDFWDSWSRGLPMDNHAPEGLLGTNFTELWAPVERASELCAALTAYFNEGGHHASGAFTYELCGARQSPFWMHPAYGRDSIRLNLMWFAGEHGDPTHTFFPRLWERLRGFDLRFHWSKHLPSVATPWTPDPARPDRAAWPEYLRARYPRWDDFMAVRAALDPGGRFLSGYWRARLGLG